ncbi:MAG: tRNA (adenosine(37)-N6)-dimethylallyltransferase MiaA [Nevskiales bacterium]|nr:tRNA (adenosine(37)-N6)-dimethylallyltransferase MiaA [Nevskiales bacterium]
MTRGAVPTVLLMGPTASGKTGLSLALAERLPVEIVSVDSAQVYRGMDIGTAKPDRATLARVPHHLVDILDPLEPYSAARFVRDALQAIEAIKARGRIPLLVGGTMLYFRALRYGLSDLPSADAGLRAQIEADAEREGWPALHARLAVRDPETAVRLHPNDQQRIQRALEIIELTGTTPSELFRRERPPPLGGDALALALNPPERSELHRRIRVRLEAMMADGFVEEVEHLYRRGDLNPELPSIRAVGYRQLWEYVAGRWKRDEAVERAVAATRQFAKRQLTWLRSEQAVEVFDPDRPDLVGEVFRRIDSRLA